MAKALKLNLSISIILLCAVLLSGTILISSYSSASSASTALATVKVAASCTLTTTGGGNYSATVPNGTSAEIAGSTMSVSCNDAGGFALYAVGYSDDTIGNNNMIGSSTNIPTNTSGTNSYWAMKINPTSGTTPTIENSFNNYHIVPDSHTKIASYSSSTGSGSLSVDATYKANISSTQLAGNYLGKVKYTLVHPQNEIPAQPIACDPGKICYNPNTNIVEGQMGKQTPTSSEITNGITLYAPNFKRDGYGFAGWSDKYDYETNPDAHFYGPNQTIAAPSNLSTDGLSLYAIWIESEGSMQDREKIISLCGIVNVSEGSLVKSPTDGTANLSSVTALSDNRDGNTYAIARLADGSCWMIENLRLDDSAILSSLNTNDPSLPLTNIYDTGSTSNHLSSTSSVAYDSTISPEGWCTNNTAACIDQSRLRTDNTTLFVDNASSVQYSNIYSYGNYYNWYSATAGNGTYNKSSISTSGDICPWGWHLPRGGEKAEEISNEFWVLIVDGINNGVKPNNYNSTSAPFYNDSTEAGPVSRAIRSFPNNFVFSGNGSGASITNRDGYGLYWTSTADTSVFSHIAEFNFNNVYPGTNSIVKWIMGVVRCVTRPELN